MQKKIIALAVAGLMSGAAFAQSSVTISGVVDAGFFSNKVDLGTSNSASETAAGYNNSATSNITFAAQEDLGGGMKAGALLQSDIRGSSQGSTGTTNTGFGTFQKYVWMSGGFGELSFGQRNNHTLTAIMTSQPFATSMGGGYSSGSGGTLGFNRLRGGGFDAYGVYGAAGRDIRPDNSLHYNSPSFGGFTFGIQWRAENDGTNETTASSGQTNIGLAYTGGPLKVAFAHSRISNATAAVAASSVVTDVNANGLVDAGDTIATTAAVAAYDSSIKHNVLGISYSFGMATLMGGYTTSKADTAAAAGNESDSRSWNIAAKFAASSNVDVMVNYLSDNDKLAVNTDRKLFGLGADYKFSKRTAAYVRYEGGDNNKAAATGKFTRYAAGLRHAF